jgi:UV DNA damage endonuclease
MAALQYCSNNGIGCFRVNSQILPLKTHPEAGYNITDLPNAKVIISKFKKCGVFAAQNNIRITFHPDQFVVLNSPREEIVNNSIEELEYQAEVADWIGADVVNIHAGGAYGDKSKSLERLRKNLDRLSPAVRERLTLENDDKIYTPEEILPLCEKEKIPLVYDIHHHRVHKDNLSEREATKRALATWNREPLFHISSPLYGWDGPTPFKHHDYIDILDFPDFWIDLDITVEIEAKAKELAIAKLIKRLYRNQKK